MKRQIKRKNPFKIGEIVYASGNAVLVTGDSNHKEYPSFEGVVISANENYDDDTWKVGFLSNSWAINAFKRTKLSAKGLSKFVEFALNI